MLRACLQSPLTHPLCLSSCEQHEAFQAAAAVVTAAEAEQREAEEEQEAEGEAIAVRTICLRTLYLSFGQIIESLCVLGKVLGKISEKKVGLRSP